MEEIPRGAGEGGPSSTNANARAIIVSMNRPLLPSAPPRNLSRQRPNHRSNLAQPGSFSVHLCPKSVPYPSQMSHGPDTKGSEMEHFGTLFRGSPPESLPGSGPGRAGEGARQGRQLPGSPSPTRPAPHIRCAKHRRPCIAGQTPGATRPCAPVSSLYRMQPPNLEGLSGRSWDRGAAW